MSLYIDDDSVIISRDTVDGEERILYAYPIDKSTIVIVERYDDISYQVSLTYDELTSIFTAIKKGTLKLNISNH